MNSNPHSNSAPDSPSLQPACQRFQAVLHGAWADGQTLSTGPSEAELQSHLANCPQCAAELKEVADLDLLLQHTFVEAELEVPALDEARVDAVLEQLSGDETRWVRQTRRSVRRLLWFAIFAIGLLGAAALLLLAYQGLR